MITTYIPSFNRPELLLARTLSWIGDTGYKWYVIVHGDEQYRLYRQAGIPGKRLIATSIPSGLPNSLTLQNNHTHAHIADTGDWFVHIDDDLKLATSMPIKYYDWEVDQKVEDLKANWDRAFSLEWRKNYALPITFASFMEEVVPLCIAQAEMRGANLIGHAVGSNYYFRSKHWRDVGYVCGGLRIIRNTGVKRVADITIEDAAFTAAHLQHYGRVLLNNYMYFGFDIFQPDGQGTLEERISPRAVSIERLVALYPGLWRVKVKKLKGIAYDNVQLRYYSTKQIAKWREEMRKPKPWFE